MEGLGSLSGKKSGSDIEWTHLMNLDQCKNGRMISPNNSNPCQPGQAVYVDSCFARGIVEIISSVGDGAQRRCLVGMMHDFEFISPTAGFYRFTPEYSLTAVITLSGLDEFMEFSNSASITLKLLIEDIEKDKKDITDDEKDKAGFSEPFYQSNYFADLPVASAFLEESESITITVACELEVKAKNTAYAKIDMGYPDNGELYFKAPELRVDYGEVVSLRESPRIMVAISKSEFYFEKPTPNLPFENLRLD